MSAWKDRSPEQRARAITQRALRRQQVREARAQQPPAPPLVIPADVALQQDLAKRFVAYECGLGLHPFTDEYLHEADLTNAKRGALIAWRKGYCVTEDGRVWNPNRIELFPGRTLKVVAGKKHHRHYTNPRLRVPQPALAFCPYVLASLCFYGLKTLHDGVCVVALDHNTRNLRRDNLVLRTLSEIAYQRPRVGRYKPPYRPPTLPPTRRDGRRKAGAKLTPERAQAIRQLLDLGWTPQQVVEKIAERGITLSIRTVNAVNIGALWA